MAGGCPGCAGGPDVSGDRHRHGILHEVGFVLANLGMVVGCLVFARRFAALRQWSWVGRASPPRVRLVLASAILLGF